MQTYYLKTLNKQSDYFEIKEFMNLGNDLTCHLVLNGEGVEERHCRIEVKDGKIHLKDLRTSSGTFVNDCQVVESYLKEGDILRVGSMELAVVTKPDENELPLLKSKNPKLMDSLSRLQTAARSEFPILLLGPSGSGKDILAQNIHELSVRKNAPLVSVNCSALTESLIESELFGHVKGAYTGAATDRKGAFESARNGTLFLDEIGDLSFALQAKLLRALENNEIRPLGADRTIKTNVRIVAATHQNLFEKIQRGEFRADLFYRLNVVQIQMPALHERMEDFENLLYHFGKTYKVRFSFDAVEILKKYPWPGNIRELKNYVARLSVTFPFTRIETFHVQQSLQAQIEAPAFKPLSSTPIDFKQTVDLSGQTTVTGVKEYEKQLIIKKLIVNSGNQRRTAAELGMPKSTLHDRIKVYGIDLKKIRERTLNSFAQTLSESMHPQEA